MANFDYKVTIWTSVGSGTFSVVSPCAYDAARLMWLMAGTRPNDLTVIDERSLFSPNVGELCESLDVGDVMTVDVGHGSVMTYVCDLPSNPSPSIKEMTPCLVSAVFAKTWACAVAKKDRQTGTANCLAARLIDIDGSLPKLVTSSKQ